MLKIHQIRNATVVIEWKENFLLVDPMLSPKGKLPSFKYFTLNRRRNPLVELPDLFHQLKPKINSVLITHCQKGHFDHLDSYGYKYLNETGLLTYCSKKDEKFLSKKNVNVKSIQDNVIAPFLGGSIETVEALHGRGFMGALMEHGRGYFIQFPDGPGLYIMGDTVLTSEIKKFVLDKKPDIIIAPAGSARFDIGDEIIMTPVELKELANITSGTIIANHLEAIDHCRQTRSSLKEFIDNEKLSQRILILDDGETYSYQK
ncbi:MBL fold metallo-hydrolase [Bacteriovorax sp. PP10]|uniref:MBL fold metallo-hydrolase n=1 Tax=Bacteriovorax antarcticus TaxID=3088717 RepID=A0ABU5VVB0_9BACT|nr:MBL fold metallo-hydrolase [Bacteriovorax sp. PP10]MEA9355970.1 MBL fold metallo-hydrolase [Bacteriovorax sp. PP10]